VADERRKRGSASPERRFAEEVGRKAERRLRSQRERKGPIWFWLGMFGLVGWSVAVPTLIGVALGIWIDKSSPGGISWTLNMLIIGAILRRSSFPSS
jgi:ATP synthase protein I